MIISQKLFFTLNFAKFCSGSASLSPLIIISKRLKTKGNVFTNYNISLAPVSIFWIVCLLMYGIWNKDKNNYFIQLFLLAEEWAEEWRDKLSKLGGLEESILYYK